MAQRRYLQEQNTASTSGGRPVGYTGSDIRVLEGLEAVRKRPGMYIGGTGSPGLQHCIWEIVDNSVDEALAGHCTRIEVTLNKDGSVTVADNGRGIPVDVEKKTGLSALEVVFTKLHAGGKFGGGGYQSAGGLHGVGASVVNALSSRLDVEVRRDSKKYSMSFQEGRPGTFTGAGPDGKFTGKGGVRTVGKSTKKDTGTTVTFWPDRGIFHPEAAIDPAQVFTRARQTAFLVPGLAIQVRDLTGAKPVEETFKFTGGIADMVDHLSTGTAACDTVHFTGTGTFTENVPVMDAKGHLAPTDVTREVHVDVAFRWSTGYDTDVKSFVNVVSTPKGGTHLKGFERGLVQAIRKGYDGTRLMKANEDPVTLEDVTEGLTAVVSVGFPEPQFEGQTKEVLGTPAITKIVQDVVNKGVAAWITGRKKAQARVVLEKVANAARNRVASRTQREAARRKTALEGASMPAKLVDCRATGVHRSEIFIVEGDSALGCFTGDTLVATAEGHPLTFEQLVDDWGKGIVHFGYATNKKGDVNVAPLIEPRVTKRNAPLVRVTLDNGEAIECTPDHLFRLRDGSYLRADQLLPDTSLMPLYRRSSSKARGDKINGYEQILMNTRGDWVFTHYLSDEWNIRHDLDQRDNGRTRHHVDFDRRNNHPDNIRRMTDEAHMRLHADNFDLERLQEGYFRYLDEEGGREAASQRMLEQWRDTDFAELCTNLSRERHTQQWFKDALHGGFQRWYHETLSDEDRAEYAERLRALQEQYWSDPKARAEASARTTAWFDADETRRTEWSERATEMWDSTLLRAWRAVMTVRQFADPAERERQSRAVRTWHENHPEFGAAHSERMKERMQPGGAHLAAIQAGRRAYCENTPREVRVQKLKDGKLRSALGCIQPLLDMSDTELRDAYESARVGTTRLKFDTVVERCGGLEQLRERARLHNHKVVKVEALDRTADVYDLTVDGYHNFALEAGVFVHNSARAARNSEYQALLPIRGKILNVQKATLAQVLANNECSSIIQVIGAGSGRTFDIEQMRYGRVVLMADADVDGSHIRTLLLTLFAKYMRPVIEEGRMFTAVPPLHKVETTGRNKETIYTYTEAEMRDVVAKLERGGKTVKKPIPRFKGLGEMNAEELWETTMDPAVRTVRQITMADAEKAEQALELLMGNEVAPRREFIIDNADRVNLDAIDA